ncbi:MAG: DNA topoisomerase 3 [Bacteroides sp.]|nr:DNA topoisomerase 3 [Bacteroides sp.]
MIVCIAEKPSVGRDIARILGATASKDGYIEGNGYQVTWALGHLCTLKEPHDYTPQWKAWSLGSLPMIPPRFGIKVMDNPGAAKQFHIVEGLIRKADMIINCGDAGQEGELIQRWIMQKAGATCPVKRLWISSLTDEAIRDGFNHLLEQSEKQSLYEAGLCRAIGDWLLGMNATRLYTMKYGQNRQVLSIGRVQTPTLALIVNRQLEIENFVPRQYWELKTLYRDTTFSAILKRSEEDLMADIEKLKEKAEKAGQPFDVSEALRRAEENNPGIEPIAGREQGLALLKQIKDSPFTITSVAKKEGREAPPRLFDLTSLQVECNRKFSFSAEETLKLIQSLYEKKVATYPRVDTTFLPDDVYPKCPGILKGLRGYEPLTAPLEGKTLPKSKKVFDNAKVTDHHAIIPTGQPPVNLTDMEKRVFDLIARRFIAVFYPDCKFVATTVMGQVEGIDFKATGRQIVEPGWRTVFGTASAEEKEDKEDDSEHSLPVFTKGESGPHVPDLVEKWTSPPKPYTEATLLRAMETAGRLVDNDELRDALKENGIGRPSTRAAIIETLFKRNYIRKERKSLVATATGVELIQLIREELLKSAELTGIWEKKLREIERRAYSAPQFLEELKQMVQEIVTTVLCDNSNRRITIQAAPVEKPKKETKKRAPRKKSAPAPDAIVGTPCPLCGKGTVIKGKTAYGCSEWRNGCTFRKPF